MVKGMGATNPLPVRAASIGLAGLLLVDAWVFARWFRGYFAAEDVVWTAVVFVLFAGVALWVLLRPGAIAYLCGALLGVAAGGLSALFVIGGNFFSEMSSPGSAEIPGGFTYMLALQVTIAVLAIILLILSPGIGRAAID